MQILDDVQVLDELLGDGGVAGFSVGVGARASTVGTFLRADQVQHSPIAGNQIPSPQIQRNQLAGVLRAPLGQRIHKLTHLLLGRVGRIPRPPQLHLVEGGIRDSL